MLCRILMFRWSVGLPQKAADRMSPSDTYIVMKSSSRMAFPQTYAPMMVYRVYLVVLGSSCIARPSSLAACDDRDES